MCIFLWGINKALNFRTYSYNISALDSAVQSILGFQTIFQTQKMKGGESDMARYIDADAWLEELKIEYTEMWESNCISELQSMQDNAKLQEAIMARPTADVVPKSEVETLAKEVHRLSQVVLYNDSVTEMKVEEAKQEVAREIFEEIETTLKLYKKYDFRSGTYFECYLEAGIAELKKKYTKESEDEP